MRDKEQESTAIHRNGRGWIKYAVGAALAFAICVLHTGEQFSNDFQTSIQGGLIIGSFLFLFLGPAHCGLQFVVRWLLGRRWQPRTTVEAVILNLPALLTFIFCVIVAASPWSARRLRNTLQRHFDPPLPDSVIVKSYHFDRGLNEGQYVFTFAVNPSELRHFLRSSGFILVNPDSDESQLTMLRANASRVMMRAVGAIRSPSAIYYSETNRGLAAFSKTVIVDSYHPDVVYYEEFH